MIDKGITAYDAWQDVQAVRDGQKTLDQVVQERGEEYVAAVIVGNLGKYGVKAIKAGGKWVVNHADDVAKSVTKPAGIPDTWISNPTNKGGGTRYSNPDNPHDFVRVMPGNLNSSNPAQWQPYVIRSKNGRIVDVNGNPVASKDPAAHIPLSDFEF